MHVHKLQLVYTSTCLESTIHRTIISSVLLLLLLVSHLQPFAALSCRFAVACCPIMLPRRASAVAQFAGVDINTPHAAMQHATGYCTTVPTPHSCTGTLHCTLPNADNYALTPAACKDTNGIQKDAYAPAGHNQPNQHPTTHVCSTQPTTPYHKANLH